TSFATSVAGTATSRRRDRPPVSERETSIEQTSAPGLEPRASDRSSEPTENWCERRDSNSHGFPHWILSPARLPVPPLSPVPCAPDEPDAATPAGRASGWRAL